MMEQLLHWVREDPSGLGRPQLAGDAPTNSMAVPMMLLCLVQQLSQGPGPHVAEKYGELGSWCVQQILQHVQVRSTRSPRVHQQVWDHHPRVCFQRNGTAILENVTPEGAELPGCKGRLQNPG